MPPFIHFDSKRLAKLPPRVARIRVAVGELGVRQGDVARSAGLTDSYLSHVLSGRASVSDQTFDRIDAALDALLADGESGS